MPKIRMKNQQLITFDRFLHTLNSGNKKGGLKPPFSKSLSSLIVT